MSVLYLECTSGISGDMCAAALLDLGASEQKVRTALESLSVPGFEVAITRTTKSGLDVCDFQVILDAAHESYDHDMAYLHGAAHQGHVEHHHHGHGHTHDHDMQHQEHHGNTHDHDGRHHEHRNLADIKALIQAADMSDGAKDLACSMFQAVAQAESHVHGKPIDQVHFHEVGAVDSIADIVAISVALDDLAPEEVIVTDIPCGKGTIRCQHGLIPVPAPATAFIAEQAHIAMRPVPIEGELVTPTGAAVIAAARTQDALPGKFTIERIGMGAGKRDYATPGILRAMLINPVD